MLADAIVLRQLRTIKHHIDMAQKLILFEDIINGSAMKSNKALMEELGKLAKYVFGESDFATENVAADKAYDIQIWSGDELDKAIANDYCKAFRFKSSFEIQDDGYVGPVMAWFFEPDGAFDDQIIVLTCESNGIFKNPRYVCGLLISEYDLDRQFGKLGGGEVDEDDDEGFKVVDGKCVFPEGATEIPDDAFSSERGIEEVEIPESVEVIGEDAFSWCTGLKTVKINGPLRKIYDAAFMECRRLVSINIPDTVTKIGDQAFSGCRNLTQLVVPDSVRVIGEDAFEGCDSLERIYIKNTELLEDTGLNDDVEIITDFDEEDILLPPAQRTPREYIFQYAVQATVGQAIKDLKKIVKDNPEGLLSCSDPFHNGSDNYITGIKEWNNIVILKCNCDEDDALPAEALLEELSDFDKDAGLVLGLGWGWELRNLDPEEDGTIFLCEDDDIFFHYDDHDLRLFSAEDLSHLFSDFAEKYPDRNVVCKTKDGTFYPVANVMDDDGMSYIVVKKSEKKISASDFKAGLDDCYWSEGGVVVSFSTTKSYMAIYAKDGPVFFEDKVDGEDVIAFRLGETLCDTRIEDPYSDCDIVTDDDTLVTIDDLCDEEEADDKEEISDEKLKNSVLKAIEELKQEPEQVTKSEDSDKGDIILKLVSYSGSVIKMMTTLSGIDGIDEEAAFNILQKLPAVVREGLSAKTAMKIGAILEEAGATIELARASDPIKEEETPKPESEKPKAAKPKRAPKPKQPERPQMEYVDLGLSVKWAKWNLGASAPEEIGDFFAWGELSPKSEYGYGNNYKFRDKGALTKYNTKATYGKVDKLKQLELSDDAAHQILGGDWRMPTAKEVKELYDNCSFSRTTINGVKGRKLKSKIKGFTDKWIFFPDTGYRISNDILLDKEGFYWTSSLYTQRPDSALTIFCNMINEGIVERYCGMPIRPVTK